MLQEKLDSLIDMAIASEIEAYTFYTAVAEKVEDQSLKDTFLDLAKEEQGHELSLKNFRNNPDLLGSLKAPEDYKIAESEKLPTLSIDMKPVDAIQLAMKKEQFAAEFYTTFASISFDSEVKDICEKLANMELSHKRRLEEIYTNMAFPEAW